MDFSENIAITPKFECQDAHFNKRQTSLHCCVGYTDKIRYYYHLSDVMKHNVSYVEAVIRDLLSKNPGQQLYRFKSDNCSTQYKCKWVFSMWNRLATELGVI